MQTWIEYDPPSNCSSLQCTFGECCSVPKACVRPNVTVGYNLTLANETLRISTFSVTRVSCAAGFHSVLCTGTGGGADTTELVDGTVTSKTAVVLFAANADVRPGMVVTGSGISGTVTVASTTGTCTGTADGAGGACALNVGSFACAVLGGDCVYAVTDLVLDSAQSLADLAVLTFEVSCTLAENQTTHAVSPCAGWLHCFCSHSNSNMLIHPARRRVCADPLMLSTRSAAALQTFVSVLTTTRQQNTICPTQLRLWMFPTSP